MAPSEASKGTEPARFRVVLAFSVVADYCASRLGAVHILQKTNVFARGFPLQLFGTFSFSHLEMCAVSERGALGSLESAKNGHQEVFCLIIFAGVDFGSFLGPFLSA